MTFIVLGIPMAALGVAWPSIARDLGRPITDLGLLIVVHVVGYFLVTTVNGELTARVGLGVLLIAAAGVGAVSLLGVAAAPSWLWLLIAIAALGVSGGLTDAGLNSYMATTRGAKAMGLLHAGFGVGSVIGPLVITGSLALGSSWETGFVLAALLQVLVGMALMVNRASFDIHRPVSTAERARAAGSRARLWLSLVIFGLYAGVEVGAGAWSFALLTEGRGLDPTTGGLVVASYWGALTAARVALGIFGDRSRPPTVLLSSAALGATGLALLWWNPVLWLGAAGLVLTGLALGPYFPMQMLLTPARFGHAFMPWMSGYQLAAASLGAAAIPGIVGIVVASSDLESVAVVLTLAAVLLVAATTILDRRSHPLRAGGA